MSQATKSALSSARERFLAGLARRGEELRPLVVAFGSDTEAHVPRAELQRRLHTLLASAQLFEEAELVDTLQALTSRLDAVGLSGEPWRVADRELLLQLLTQLRSHPEASQLTAAAPRAPSAKPGVLSSGARPSLPVLDAAAGRHTSERTLPSSVLLTRVLLVCSRPHAASLRAVLDDAPVELVHAADPEQALALLQSASPTCALLAVEFATLPDIDLVRSLQGDTQSRLGGVYLLLPAGAAYDAEFVRQTGADGVLIEPISWPNLEPFVDRANERRGRGGLRALGDHPEGTVEEIASFFAEEVRSGLLHALREETTERIRLPDTRELSEVARSAIDRARAHLSGHGPAKPPPPAAIVEAVTEPEASNEPSPEEVAEAVRVLAGKRVLVVDDDAAVLWFFAGLLREAGATVLQARDGREALELARRKRPQLVVSDILMPKMDGFELCRELRRDVLLARVPVVLLTWNDEQLTRAAGTPAGPSAYLRKEAGGGEALSVLAAALLPRQQLAAALLDPGAIAGTVEELGIASVLECVAEARPNARLRVEDNSRLFEVDIRDGQRLSVTKTAADGSFTRGERALSQLLGVKSGSFSVLTQSGSLRSPLPEALPRALSSAGKELSIVLDAVSGERLAQVALLSFDEALLAVWGSDLPATLREVLESFQTSSVTAKQLLESGRFDAESLEQSLRDLAAYGVITGVWDVQGADLIGHARRQRSIGPVSSATLPGLARAEIESFAAPVKLTTPELPTFEAHAAPSPSLVAEVASFDHLDGVADLLEPEAHPGEARISELDLAVDRTGDSVPASALAAAASEPPKRAASFPPPLPLFPKRAETALNAARAAVRPVLGRIRTARHDAVRLGVSLAALAALGYLGGMLLEDPSRLFSSAAAPAPQAVAQKSALAEPHETSLRSGTDPGLALGTVLPYIDTSRGVAVGSDEGLIVFEQRGSEPVPALEIDRHPLQTPPLALALPANAHQLSLHSGDETLILTLVVRAGETRIITLPLPKP
jgi:CheY-like chemotaxis protein